MNEKRRERTVGERNRNGNVMMFFGHRRVFGTLVLNYFFV